MQQGETIDYNDAVLVLVSGCSHGAEVTITPSAIARVVGAIRAADGNYKAIELTGSFPGGYGDPGIQGQGKLTVRQGHKVIGIVTLGGGSMSPATGAP